MDPYLAAFDNVSASKLDNKGQRINGMVFMPCFTENVAPHLDKLMKEDNLIRYSHLPTNINIESIKEISYKVKDCVDIFRNNILQTVYDNPPYKMRIPSPERGKVFQFEMHDL